MKEIANMTEPQAPEQPVANLAQARKEQAAARKAEAASKAAHPAGKKAPAKQAPAKKPAPAKADQKPAVEAEKRQYSAVGRGGVTRTVTSASPVAFAVDCKISGRRASHFAQGAVISFFVDEAKAQAAADRINQSGGDWSDAVVIPAALVGKAAS
jgi:hypothetical protein